MITETKNIIKKLDEIKSELDYVKKHMIDIDNIMTEDDYEALNNYRKEKSAHRLVSHKQLKKELGL